MTCGSCSGHGRCVGINDLNRLYSPAVAFTGSWTGTTLTVSHMSSGEIFVGQSILGDGINQGTKIASLGSGTGGKGTYVLSTAQLASGTNVFLTSNDPYDNWDASSGAACVCDYGYTGSACEMRKIFLNRQIDYYVSHSENTLIFFRFFCIHRNVSER